jgi:hypothetical protein
MSQVLDKKVEDMDKMAQALDKQGSNRSTKSSTDLQVAGQEFSYLMNSSAAPSSRRSAKVSAVWHASSKFNGFHRGRAGILRSPFRVL